METRTYRVEGLSCIDCAGRIKASVNQLEGVEDCEVDHITGELSFNVNAPDFDDAAVVRIVEETGHKLAGDAEAVAGSPIIGFLRFLLGTRDTALTAAAGLLTIVGLVIAAIPLEAPAHVPVFALAILVGGFPVARHAVQELLAAHNLGINVLMVIAVVGAMAIGEWAEGAIVVVLFALGEALEGYAADRARGALESLMELVPPTALRLNEEGETEVVPVEALEVGDRVLIRPGDRIGVDGVVRQGVSAVDQSTITGESMPVDKTPGREVFASTVNISGALTVEVTRRAEDNTLSRMISLVREAQSRHAPVQRFLDRFARVYTPVVAGVALVVATVPPLAFDAPFWGDSGWLMRALQMLVIACPCALVISTPVTVVSALTNAASKGVLIKGGRTLEALGQIRTFAFDKTGTLTRGQPVTTDILDVCRDLSHKHDGLQYAAAVESQSSHPLARALVAEAEARKLSKLPAQDVSLMSGRGVTGRVGDRQVTVASHLYFDKIIPHAEAICRDAERLAEEGKTVMLVCHDEDICSVFAVADTLRPESRQALAELRELGDIRTVMLTGDGARVAHAIGREAGVDDVRAELLPEEKVTAIQSLMAERGAVAMVGDGVNDAPALAQATVGIAMGGAGSDQAMETADVVLMGDDLRPLPFLVRLSRRTKRVIGANIIFALAVKALVFVLAALGLATLWMAIVADVGASMLVILNGMRMRGMRHAREDQPNTNESTADQP